MVIEMKRLSLNSDGAFLTMMQSLIPQSSIINSTENEKILLLLLIA